MVDGNLVEDWLCSDMLVIFGGGSGFVGTEQLPSGDMPISLHWWIWILWNCMIYLLLLLNIHMEFWVFLTFLVTIPGHVQRNVIVFGVELLPHCVVDVGRK